MKELIRYMYPIFLWSVEVIHSTITLPLRTAEGDTVWCVVPEPASGRVSVIVMVTISPFRLPVQCRAGCYWCCIRLPEYRSGRHPPGFEYSPRTQPRTPPRPRKASTSGTHRRARHTYPYRCPPPRG